jgi:hypothetical protein
MPRGARLRNRLGLRDPIPMSSTPKELSDGWLLGINCVHPLFVGALTCQ